jgi:hypothetical protein
MFKPFDEIDRELEFGTRLTGLSRRPRPLVFREREPETDRPRLVADLVDMVVRNHNLSDTATIRLRAWR